MQIRSKRILRRNKIALPLLAAGLIVAIAFTAWVYTSRDQTAVDDRAIDYSPATKEDKEFNDAHKAQLGSDSTEQSPSNNVTPDSTKQQVTPTITAYGQPDGPGGDFKLNGFVAGVIETDGTCTLTLTKDGKTATISKASLQNAQNTSCGQLVIPYAQLSTGTWQAVLSYSSSASVGSSTKTQIEVR